MTLCITLLDEHAVVCLFIRGGALTYSHLAGQVEGTKVVDLWGEAGSSAREALVRWFTCVVYARVARFVWCVRACTLS